MIGSLGIISNPSQSQTVVTCREWAQNHLKQGNIIVVPEIADYEVRRELLRADKTSGIQRLDLDKTTFAYLPITTAIMLRTAQFWAQARKTGRPTADSAAIDADVILAAQAAILVDEGSEALIATSNPRHLSMFAPAAEEKMPKRRDLFAFLFIPLTPLLFCLTSGYMLQASLSYTGIGALVGVEVLLAGVPLLFLARRKAPKADSDSKPASA